MAESSKHMYRSSEGVLGGVCAGIAMRFDIDAALVRLLAVLLCIVSLGAFALVYVAVWLILPAAPDKESALEVGPAEFESEIYRQVVSQAPSSNKSVNTSSVASIPPTPPAAASGYYAASAAHTNYSTAAVVGQANEKSFRPIAAGLVVGVVLIVLGAIALLSSFTQAFAVVQYWPLLLVALGLLRMVLPAKDGSRSLTTWLGVLIVFVGLVALVASLGIYTVDIAVWVNKAGPMLLIAFGLFVIGRGAKSDLFIVGAGLALLLFFVIGVYFSLQYNALEMGVSLPSPESIFEWEAN